MADLMRIKMAAFASVNLKCRYTSGAYAFSITGGLLVAFNHRNINIVFKHDNGFSQQCGLA